MDFANSNEQHWHFLTVVSLIIPPAPWRWNVQPCRAVLHLSCPLMLTCNTGRVGIIMPVNRTKEDKTMKEVMELAYGRAGTILFFELSDFRPLFFPQNRAVLFFITISIFLFYNSNLQKYCLYGAFILHLSVVQSQSSGQKYVPDRLFFVGPLSGSKRALWTCSLWATAPQFTEAAQNLASCASHLKINQLLIPDSSDSA